MRKIVIATHTDHRNNVIKSMRLRFRGTCGLVVIRNAVNGCYLTPQILFGTTLQVICSVASVVGSQTSNKIMATMLTFKLFWQCEATLSIMFMSLTSMLLAL